MTQIRQAKIFYIKETNEYQVKLFINEIEVKKAVCYFIETLEEAKEIAQTMEIETVAITEDFCKAGMKRHYKNKIIKHKIIKHEFPIYNIQTSEVIGWIELDEKESLPQAITIRNKTYKKE
jgi:hypothetical protein